MKTTKAPAAMEYSQAVKFGEIVFISNHRMISYRAAC